MTNISDIQDEEVIDDVIINEVQKHRLTLLRETLKGDKKVPTNTILLMNSLTDTALANKRITKEDENMKNGTEQVIAMTRELLLLNKHPFEGINGNTLIPPSVPDIVLVDGELD